MVYIYIYVQPGTAVLLCFVRTRYISSSVFGGTLAKCAPKKMLRYQVCLEREYSSTRQHLRIWYEVKNLRLRFTEKSKNLQVSVCAELDEEVRIRNWESAKGSADKNPLECTAPLKIKKLPKHPLRPHQAPNQAASSPNPSSQLTLFFFIVFSPKKRGSIRQIL